MLKGIAGSLVAVGLWEFGRLAGVVDREAVASVPAAVGVMVRGLLAGDLLGAIGATLREAAAGWLIALALAVPSGCAIGLSPRAERATRPLFEFVRSIPSIAFLAIVIILLGLGFKTKLFIVAFASFWPMLFNAKVGVEAVDPRFLETGRLLGLGRLARLLRITLVAALPSIVTGLRLAASTALVVAITADIMVGQDGIGYYVETLRLAGQNEGVWGAVFATGILGYLMNVLLLRIERGLLGWSPEHRAT